MAEVAVQNGQAVAKQDKAAKLEELAERINEKHRAHDATVKSALRQMSTALDYALDAGDLLIEAKAIVGHGNFKAWVRDNCEVSKRRAEEYMYIAGRRDKIEEESKARHGAFSSIRAALDFLRRTRYTGGGWFQQESELPTPEVEKELTPAEAARQREKERQEAAKEQRLMRKAEFALRTGQLDPPADLTIEEAKGWQGAVYNAQMGREAHVEPLLDVLAHQLHILSHHADPEKVGRYLAVPTNNREVNEDRAAMLEELRDALPWLQRVLDEAERMQGSE